MSLAGRRILITRAADDADALTDLLEGRGAEVVAMPTIHRAPPEDLEAVRAAAVRVHEHDAVAVGSAAALRPLAELMDRPSSVVLGCVGAKTASTVARDPGLAERFVGPRVVPDTYRAEALVEALRRYFGGLEGRRVCVPRAPEGRLELPAGLRVAGAEVLEVLTYRIVAADPPSEALWAQARRADAVLFLSGQTLASFIDLAPSGEGRALRARALVGVIGPVAADKAAAIGVRVDVVPNRATQEALVEAVCRRLSLSSTTGS